MIHSKPGVLEGEYKCEICGSNIKWYGTYDPGCGVYSCVTNDKSKLEVNVKVKNSQIKNLHCVEFDCPYCGKHVELVIDERDK